MKIFISQPMNGKTEEQIRKEREEVILKLNRRYNGNVEIGGTKYVLSDVVYSYTNEKNNHSA